MRPDNAFLLLAGSRSEAERAQAASLRSFFRRMLARRFPGNTEIVEADLDPAADAPHYGDGLTARVLAPVLPHANLFVFDLPALLDRLAERKYAVLAPLSLAAGPGLLAPADGDQADRLAALADLQEALRAAERVIVFTPEHAADLAALGARQVRVVPLPAMPPRHRDTLADLLLIRHDIAPDLAEAVRARLADALPALTLRLLEPAAPDDPAAHPPLEAAAGAPIHVHLGAIAGRHSFLRVIDSYAVRSAVIQLMAEAPAEDELTREQMRVEHLRSGICVQAVGDIVTGVRRLAADTALGEVFRRNGDRMAEGFNARVESALWAALQ